MNDVYLTDELGSVTYRSWWEKGSRMTANDSLVGHFHAKTTFNYRWVVRFQWDLQPKRQPFIFINQWEKHINRVAKHAGKQPKSKWHDDQRTTDAQAAEFAQVVLQSGAQKSGAFEVSSPGSATFLLHKGPRLENSSLPTWNHDLH